MRKLYNDIFLMRRTLRAENTKSRTVLANLESVDAHAESAEILRILDEQTSVLEPTDE